MTTTIRLLGCQGVGEALGVTRHAVHKWRERHPSGSDHAFPEPDVLVDGTPGWRPERVAEIAGWREQLPGRGAGGGRPPASRRAYLAAADARGLTRDEGHPARRPPPPGTRVTATGFERPANGRPSGRSPRSR